MALYPLWFDVVLLKPLGFPILSIHSLWNSIVYFTFCFNHQLKLVILDATDPYTHTYFSLIKSLVGQWYLITIT